MRESRSSPCDKTSSLHKSKPKKSFFKKLNNNNNPNLIITKNQNLEKYKTVPNPKTCPKVPQLRPLTQSKLDQLEMESNLKNAEMRSLKSLETMGSVYQSIHSKRPQKNCLNFNDPPEVSIYRKTVNLGSACLKDNTAVRLSYQPVKASPEMMKQFQGFKETPVHRNFKLKHFSSGVDENSNPKSRLGKSKFENNQQFQDEKIGDHNFAHEDFKQSRLNPNQMSQFGKKSLLKKNTVNENYTQRNLEKSTNNNFPSQYRSVRKKLSRQSHAEKSKSKIRNTKKSQRAINSMKNLPESVFNLQTKIDPNQTEKGRNSQFGVRQRISSQKKIEKGGSKSGKVMGLYDKPAGKSTGSFRGRGSWRQIGQTGGVRIQFNQ